MKPIFTKAVSKCFLVAQSSSKIKHQNPCPLLVGFLRNMIYKGRDYLYFVCECARKTSAEMELDAFEMEVWIRF